MTKQYYCEMDNSVFNTEEELIHHIKQRYVKVMENKNHETSDLLSKLQIDFPDYKINLKDGNGWYTQYIIELLKDDFVIKQYYGNEEKEFFKRHYPDTYEKVKYEISEKINIYRCIISELTSKYKFHDFKFKGYSYGYSEDEHSYDFKFKLNETDEHWIHESYHPYNENLEQFINGFDQYFAKVLEGTPEEVEDSGYFIDYMINGVKIGTLMQNKKVRLEVLE